MPPRVATARDLMTGKDGPAGLAVAGAVAEAPGGASSTAFTSWRAGQAPAVAQEAVAAAVAVADGC